MSWKDKLKDAQKTNTSSFPKIETELVLEMKENAKGKPAFRFWNSETEKAEYYDKPIQGVYIGRAFRCFAFDPNWGSKGGSYMSALYLYNTNITIFSPTMQASSKRFTGSREDVEKWLTSQGVKDNVSTKLCLLLATKQGLYEIRTNTSIGIDMFNKLDDDKLLSNKIVLTPTIYDPDNENISSGTKKILGKFASKNPPKYAEIDVGEEITEEDAAILNLEKFADMYNTWKTSMLDKLNTPVKGEETVDAESADKNPLDEGVSDLPF